MHEPLRYSTPTALVLDAHLRGRGEAGLIEVVSRLRDEGLSWREVAARIEQQTGHEVSHESLRQWSQRWQVAA